ncbi:hypothetical protein HZZ13_14735 [Bradyrhizobium sp. CNPSo 4010]|uniref:Uncharacterized protein n=1 Tax=Bradyrhizobium agreste TaxID=2751811 RepID=A0ABS0PPK0_9BRAD|nr:hypothetical protein [Bradyrhizobium agreste]MBH5399020.1 hypothetical protein [Bradyrhizobium agreste]
MASNWTDIKIVELDEAATGPSGQGALVRIVLKLSQSAPSEWAEYFNNAWSQHIYMMKRRASVSGRTLEIVCMPNELEEDHLPELKKIIAETNQAYGAYANEQTRRRQEQEEIAQRQKDELAQLKGRLKLD